MDSSTLAIILVVVSAAVLVWVFLPLLRRKFGFTSRGPYDDVIISGRKRGVIPDDILSAISTDLAFPHLGRRDKLREIEIVSPDEVHLFWGLRKSESSSYEIVKRVSGQWQYITQVTATSYSKRT